MRRHHLVVATVLIVATACDADAGEPAADGSASPPAASGDVSATAAAAGAPDPTEVRTSAGTTPAATDRSVPAGTSVVTGDAPPIAVEPLYQAGDIDNGLRPFIDLAAADLAMRLDIDVSSVSTHAAVLVVWPDASVGCPQPDMRYAQVLTDGSVIELEAAGLIYRYHTGGASGPFLCTTPLTKAPPGELLDAGSAEDN